MKKTSLILIYITVIKMYSPALALAQTQSGAPAQDTILCASLREVLVKSERHWANDTVRYRYNQKRYYVGTVLPYLDAAMIYFGRIDTSLAQNEGNKRSDRKIVSAYEQEIRGKFEDQLRKLNVTQGALLVTLIERQTGRSVYDLLRNYKSDWTAIKWRAWGGINGISLNHTYDPNNDKDLEQIMAGYGRPLPDFYKTSN